MKKIISIALLLVMMLSLFAGCAKEDTPDTGSGLDKAKEYLEGMYKSDPVDTPADYTLVGVVRVEGVDYNVEWSADSDKITAKRNDKMVTIDVPENSAEEIKYVLTATISDAEGNKVTTTFNRRIPAAAAAGLTMEEIVELAYQLEDGEVMEGNATLTGVITSVKTPYDPGYQNITVKIQIGELSDKLIECYRLKGEGAADLCVGDTITVTGSLKNYSGTIEFDAGCSLDNVVPGERVQAPEDPKEIMDAAYALEEGKSLPYEATLTGVISEINTPYDSGYKNLSMTIVIEGCEDKPLYCYRAKGEGAETLAVGDTVSVTGYLMNYKGGVQYGAGSIISNIVKGEGNTDVPSTPGDEKPGDEKPTEKPTEKPSDNPGTTTKPSSLADQIKAAQALAEGEKLPYTSTMTGKITKINEAYSADYQNITVTIEVSGKSYKIYRVKGKGADGLAVGDTITVTGNLQNWYGDVQMAAGGNLDKVVKGEKAPSSQTAIVDAAYALEKDTALDYEATLTGKVTEIQTPYDSYYKNISVVIKVEGRESKPILCYRLKGDGVDKIAVNDTITVTGILKNYNGIVEFDASCVMDKRVSGGGTAVVAPSDPKQIVDAAFALEPGATLPYKATLTGKILKIDTPYDSGYKNITVTIEVEGSNGTQELKCFRMKGDGAESLKVGDTITVTGTIKNYVHQSSGDSEVEFDAGCTFVKA